MKRLWVHECFRVFYDRLVDDKDRQWLLDTLKAIVNEKFHDEFDGLFAHLDAGEKGYVSFEDMRCCFFGDFIQSDNEPEDREYDEVGRAGGPVAPRWDPERLTRWAGWRRSQTFLLLSPSPRSTLSIIMG